MADASHQLRSPLTASAASLGEHHRHPPPPRRRRRCRAGRARPAVARRRRVVGAGPLGRSAAPARRHRCRGGGRRPGRRLVGAGRGSGRHARSGPGSPASVFGWLVPGHLEQIIDNLLANALEATPAGRSVQLAVRHDGDVVEVHVIDEGTGMGEQERLHAFDRFWRGSTSRPGAGAGLGLSIVRQLARASSAQTELREAPSGGIDAVVRMRSGGHPDVRAPLGRPGRRRATTLTPPANVPGALVPSPEAEDHHGATGRCRGPTGVGGQRRCATGRRLQRPWYRLVLGPGAHLPNLGHFFAVLCPT